MRKSLEEIANLLNEAGCVLKLGYSFQSGFHAILYWTQEWDNENLDVDQVFPIPMTTSQDFSIVEADLVDELERIIDK